MHKNATFKQDQAAGLRRIMATPAPRLLTLVSANNSDDQSRLMTNLAASLASQGNKTLLIHASTTSSERVYNINTLQTLLDYVQCNQPLNQALRLSTHGFHTAKLMQKSQLLKPIEPMHRNALNDLCQRLSSTYDVVLVDANLNTSGQLPLSGFNDGQIIIKLDQQADAVKQAYTQIKRLHSLLDKYQFGILADGMSDAKALHTFKKINQVSAQYLGVKLNYLGAIPKDEQLSKAMQLGRTVMDAFPLAKASKAFEKIAMQFDYASTSNQKQVVAI